MGRTEKAVEELRTLANKLESFMNAVVAGNEATRVQIDALTRKIRGVFRFRYRHKSPRVVQVQY